jgi:hypothetical protein
MEHDWWYSAWCDNLLTGQLSGIDGGPKSSYPRRYLTQWCALIIMNDCIRQTISSSISFSNIFVASITSTPALVLRTSKLPQESRVQRNCGDYDQRKTKRSRTDDAFGALLQSWQRSILVIWQRNLPLDQCLPMIPRFTIREQEILFWYPIFQSVQTLKEMLHIGSDRIPNVIRVFATTHELLIRKPIGPTESPDSRYHNHDQNTDGSPSSNVMRTVATIFGIARHSHYQWIGQGRTVRTKILSRHGLRWRRVQLGFPNHTAA